MQLSSRWRTVQRGGAAEIFFVSPGFKQNLKIFNTLGRAADELVEVQGSSGSSAAPVGRTGVKERSVRSEDGAEGQIDKTR